MSKLIEAIKIINGVLSLVVFMLVIPMIWGDGMFWLKVLGSVVVIYFLLDCIKDAATKTHKDYNP